MTIDQIKNLMGSLETPPELRLPEKDIELGDVAPPTEFFSAQQWPKC
jgi:hypothetical protein